MTITFIIYILEIKTWQESGRSARGEMVDFDLLAIKQQIADAKNRVEVVATQDFVDHRPVHAVTQAVQPPAAKIDDDRNDWEIPASVLDAASNSANSTDGALAAAADLVKSGKRK